MMDRDDLRAAVGAGIVTEAQAASLASLADSRRGARTDLAVGDEPFELFKGFNEVFIVVGLLILAMGLGWCCRRRLRGLKSQIRNKQRCFTDPSAR